MSDRIVARVPGGDRHAERDITADIEVIPIDKVNEAFDRVVPKGVRFGFVIDSSILD